MDFIGFCHEKLERRKVKGFGNCWLLHCERVRICNNHVMLQVWLLEYPAVMHWMPWMLADFCGLQVDWKHGLFCSGRTASRPAMRLLNGWQYPLANLSKLVYIHVYTNIYIYINIHECVYIYMCIILLLPAPTPVGQWHSMLWITGFVQHYWPSIPSTNGWINTKHIHDTSATRLCRTLISWLTA